LQVTVVDEAEDAKAEDEALERRLQSQERQVQSFMNTRRAEVDAERTGATAAAQARNA
jgi:hypothetical protein